MLFIKYYILIYKYIIDIIDNTLNVWTVTNSYLTVRT